jgi:hypothetical protein
MSAADSFRGIKGIREIKARMSALADFYRKFKPEVTEIVLERSEYDLIARWPRAADFEGFILSHNGIFYEGLRLTYDTGEGRYVKPEKPEQAVIR